MSSYFIETKRIYIRKLNLETDYALFYKQQKDEDIMQFFGGPREDNKIYSISNALQNQQEQYGFSVGPVFNKKTNECMGRAGLAYVDFKGPPDVELAIFLYKQFWNKGYATEICNAIIDYAFNVLNKDYIFATIDPKNGAITRVLTKIGMKFVKEDYYDTLEKSVHFYVKNK